MSKPSIAPKWCDEKYSSRVRCCSPAEHFALGELYVEPIKVAREEIPVGTIIPATATKLAGMIVGRACTLVALASWCQNKYQNFAQFLDGVSGVDEALSDGERLVLVNLAIRADWRTAVSRPGTSILAKRSGRDERSVRRILEKLWHHRKLLARESRGDGGRGIATVWKILVEDPRFPLPKSRPRTDQDSDPKPGHNSVRVSVEQNQDVGGLEPGHHDSKTRTLVPLNPGTALSTLPVSHSLLPSLIPSEAEAGLPAAAERIAAFEVFKNRPPFGSDEFQKIWTETYACRGGQHPVDLMETAIRKCQGSHIRVPSEFFAIKRALEARRVAADFPPPTKADIRTMRNAEASKRFLEIRSGSDRAKL